MSTSSDSGSKRLCQISDHDAHASVALMGDAGEDRW